MKLILTFFICIFLFTSCKKKSNPTSFEVKEYPLDSGTVWNYDIKYETYNFRPIVQGATHQDRTYHFSAKVIDSGEVVLPNGVRSHNFVETFQVEQGQPFVSHNYYVQRNDSLLLVAYRGGSQVAPKQNVTYSFQYKKKNFSSVDELVQYLFVSEYFNKEASLKFDSLMFPSNPIPVIVFPLKKGKRWEIHNGDIFSIRKVIDVEVLKIDSLYYYASKIQKYINGDTLDQSITLYDWFGTQGLMKRSITVKNIAISDEQHPDGFGYIDIKEEFNLTSFK